MYTQKNIIICAIDYSRAELEIAKMWEGQGLNPMLDALLEAYYGGHTEAFMVVKNTIKHYYANGMSMLESVFELRTGQKLVW